MSSMFIAFFIYIIYILHILHSGLLGLCIYWMDMSQY